MGTEFADPAGESLGYCSSALPGLSRGIILSFLIEASDKGVLSIIPIPSEVNAILPSVQGHAGEDGLVNLTYNMSLCS